MIDPHVEALHYRIEHAKTVVYEASAATEHDEPGFMVKIKDGQVYVAMKDHFATAEAARDAIQPFLDAWEVAAGLQYGPGEFEFVYESATVVDRQSPAAGGPESIYLPLIVNVSRFGTPTLQVSRSLYPDPPHNIKRNPDVDLLLGAYRQYRERKRTLADAANFCLTVLESPAGGRRRAAQRYSISKDVLRTIGRLAGTKGGADARKAEGVDVPYTAAERHWLEGAIKILIRRVAECAFDPLAAFSQIRMSDLPALST